MTDHFSMKRENSEMDEMSMHDVKIKSEIRDPDLDSDIFKEEETSYPENKINISEPDNGNGRVTSLEQLNVDEFNSELARPKVYENRHKNVLAIWLDLVL